jgi:AcrR family transcriptional regulator
MLTGTTFCTKNEYMNDIFINSQKYKQREAKVLETALEVFAEYGYRKAGMEDISNRLGLAVGTLYRYAQDKQDLYGKAVAYGFSKWQSAAIAAAETSEDPLPRFRLFCTEAFSYLRKEPRLRKILAGDPALFPVLDAKDPFASINKRSVDILQQLIQDGVDKQVFSVPDSRMAARILFSIYQLSIEKAYVEESGDEQALFEQSLDLVLSGLLTRRQ